MTKQGDFLIYCVETYKNAKHLTGKQVAELFTRYRVWDYYDKLGPEFSEQIRSMLVFDALIYNEDRHFGNFGVLRDNHSGNIIASAPIFDNGLSLFCYAGKEDYANLDE